MEFYYYEHMNKMQQNACHAMKTGILSLADSFLVPRMMPGELADIFFQLRLDCPEIFWATGFRYRDYPDSGNLQVLPEYLFEKSKIKEHQKNMRARVEKLARQARGLGEWEKEKYIHDFICENVRYDKLKKAYSHEIIGPLGHGVGVCEGIAKAVKVVCDALGGWCISGISEANPDRGIRYRHAWNVVRIEGKYYHLDATFDLSVSGQEIRYDYFNMDDRKVFRDHEPALMPLPPCTDGSRFYYLEKKLSFTKYEDIENRACQAVKKNRAFTFHWRGSYLTREVLGELMKILEGCAAKKGRHVSVSLNWPQAVLRATFPEGESTEASLVFEEANEGEQDG